MVSGRHAVEKSADTMTGSVMPAWYREGSRVCRSEFLGFFDMSNLPPCPQCQSSLTYEDGGGLYVCAECGYEWLIQAEAVAESDERGHRDAAGNVLQDGDSVTVIKDLKLKGSGGVVKMGTKVKNIRLVDGDHDIDCKIDGFGAMSLKSEFVRKI